MGVRQRGHSGFSLHHSVIQFLHGSHQREDERERRPYIESSKNALKTIPAEYMAT